MADRPDYQTLTATLPSVSEAVLDLSPQATLTEGELEDLVVYSPAGTISRPQTCYIDCAAPTGATAGNAYCYVYLPGAGGTVTAANFTYSDTLVFDSGTWGYTGESTVVDQAPPSGSENYWLARNFCFDASYGLGIQYQNNTTGGTSSPSQRTMVLKVVVEDLP